jgi:TonB family protein
MQMILRTLALVLAAAAAQAAPAQEAPQPARWQVDGSTSRCVLTRRLEGSPVPATFVLRTIPGSGRYDVVLTSPEFPESLRRGGRMATVSFAPGGATYERRAAEVALPGQRSDAIMLGPLPADFAAGFARATTLTLSYGGSSEGSWTIPAAARAAEAFRFCETEKQVEWGADRAGLEAGATQARPIGDSYTWLTERDVGLLEAANNQAMTAVFRLVVGPDGRASECTVLESGGTSEIDSRACRALARRARFEPARDPQGTAVTGVFVHTHSLRNQAGVEYAPR